MVDIVGYSRLSEVEQLASISRLTKIVRKVLRGQRLLEKPLFLPTGDGMAIAFRGQPELAIEVADSIHRAYGKDRITLKIAVHSGPVFRIKDINKNWNVAGAGINLAQRTLSCCSSGHILVADPPAGSLKNTGIAIASRLTGPYRFLVKHQIPLTAFNYYDKDRGIGDPAEPVVSRFIDDTYVPFANRLRELGISGTGPQPSETLLKRNNILYVIDGTLLEKGVYGFSGVGPNQVKASFSGNLPAVPEYVLEHKRSSSEPTPNRRKVSIRRMSLPMSDQESFGIEFDAWDYWTTCSVEACMSRVHQDLESSLLELDRFPGIVACHVVLLTADKKLILGKRSDDVRWEKLAWSASFEEGIDADRDTDEFGRVNPARTVKRGLGRCEEIGLSETEVDSATIKFVAVIREWENLARGLVAIVSLPTVTSSKLLDLVPGSWDGRAEFSCFDSIPFTHETCMHLLQQNSHSVAGEPMSTYRLHRTSRLRILAAMFSEFGYAETIPRFM